MDFSFSFITRYNPIWKYTWQSDIRSFYDLFGCSTVWVNNLTDNLPGKFTEYYTVEQWKSCIHIQTGLEFQLWIKNVCSYKLSKVAIKMYTWTCIVQISIWQVMLHWLYVISRCFLTWSLWQVLMYRSDGSQVHSCLISLWRMNYLYKIDDFLRSGVTGAWDVSCPWENDNSEIDNFLFQNFLKGKCTVVFIIVALNISVKYSQPFKLQAQI